MPAERHMSNENGVESARKKRGDSKMIKTLTFAIVVLCCANAFAQSVGTKLDHVVIAVHDLEAAKRLYSGLGFSIPSRNGRHPTGTENSVALLSGGSTADLIQGGDAPQYLELITPYDTSLSGGPSGGGRGYAEYLIQGDGARSAGLRIASAEQAARDLSAAGLKIKGPTPGTIMMAGEKDPAPPRWWTISFVDQLASRPLFLIHYAPRPAATEPVAPRPTNPNSASSLSALLIAVNDLPSAAAGYGNIGKVSDQEILLPEFGAVGKEILLERGSILLLRATDPSGPTARRLKERGEGIFAVRLGVTDLDQARKQIGDRNVSKDPQSILVSPENASGVWLQFQAARP
jgi:catechol 2,3-dioxygenase-like lactoylglutathione lyase family enzyme